MLYAITREVSEALGGCELTHLARVEMDVGRARGQHGGYEEALRGLGVRVVRAEGGAGPGMPDGVFVEDTAVVVEEGAVMTVPGARSRWGEVAGVAAVLGRYRELRFMEGAGRMDGGDVLRVGRKLYVGLSGRTNREGLEQLRGFVGAWGYEVEGVEVRGCLHLKSAATVVAEGVLLVNPLWVPAGRGGAFGGMERILVDEGEGYGGNALLVGGAVIYPEHFPRTRERLERRGVRVVTVACDELAKAEGAVTCCSIVFEGRDND